MKDIDQIIEEMKGTIKRGDCLYCGSKDTMVYSGNICFVCWKCGKSVHENTFYACATGLPFISKE